MANSASYPWGLHILTPLSDTQQKSTELDIIAVHGINGHPFQTWTTASNDKTATNWLRDAIPPILPNARVMTFGYDARFVGPSTAGIVDDARDLLARIHALRAGEESEKAPLIFIAHSLGGLVVKQALVLARNYSDCSSILSATKAIFFFGTPHRGSSLASYGYVLARVLQAASVNTAHTRLKLLWKHSDSLSQLTDLFRWLAPSIHIVSFYETEILPSVNSLVVEKDSAILGFPHEEVIPLRANHRSMCHIPSADDSCVGAIVLPALRRVVQQILKARASDGDVQGKGTQLLREQKGFPSQTSANKIVERHFLVPVAQNCLFTGRAQILAQIKSLLQPGPRKQTRVILTGLGGVGKTQIATAYAYDAFATYEVSTVFWTFAGSKERLIKSFTDIAKHLGLYGPIVSQQPSRSDLRDVNLEGGSLLNSLKHVEAVKEWLAAQESAGWLLVFDNVDDLESFDITEYFPKTAFGHIMVTSRRQQAGRFGNQIEVDVMDDEDALALLLRCSRLTQSAYMNSARKLVVVLGNLPLAIDQAGAYIAEQGIDFDDYLQIFNNTRAHVLEHKPPRATWSYEHSIFTTWEISYGALQKDYPVSARLLDIAACFGSDDVPLSLVMTLAREPSIETGLFLRSFIDSINDRKDYDKILGEVPEELLCSHAELAVAIGRLLSYSLLQRKHETKGLLMHPLVHAWLQDRRQDERDRVRTVQIAIAAAHRALFNATDLSRFADVDTLYPHALICNAHFEIYPDLFHFVDAPRLAACVIAVDAWVPLSMDEGTLLRSDRFYQLVANRTASAGSESWQIPPDLLMLRKAYRLSSMGLREESSSVCEEYFATAKPSNKFELMYQSCMAQMYGPSLFRRLMYDRAEAVFELSQTWCDPSNYMSARKQLVLAGIACDKNELARSEAYCLSCRDILEAKVGPDFFIWNVWHQLTALCYIAQGRYEEAEKLVAPRMRDRLVRAQENRLIFTFSDYELAEVYSRALRKQNKHDNALDILQELLDVTSSTVAPPARALGELSFQITNLDKMTANPSPGVTGPIMEKLIEETRLTYERAAQAYESEWTRGTWVFKFFDRILDEFRQRTKNHLQMSKDTEVAGIPDAMTTTQFTRDASARSETQGSSLNWTSTLNATGTGKIHDDSLSLGSTFNPATQITLPQTNHKFLVARANIRMLFDKLRGK